MKSFAALILLTLTCLAGCSQQDNKPVQDDDSLRQFIPKELKSFRK